MLNEFEAKRLSRSTVSRLSIRVRLKAKTTQLHSPQRLVIPSR